VKKHKVWYTSQNRTAFTIGSHNCNPCPSRPASIPPIPQVRWSYTSFSAQYRNNLTPMTDIDPPTGRKQSTGQCDKQQADFTAMCQILEATDFPILLWVLLTCCWTCQWQCTTVYLAYEAAWTVIASLLAINLSSLRTLLWTLLWSMTNVCKKC